MPRFLIALLLAPLPEGWRRRLVAGNGVPWAAAAAVSGLLKSGLAIFGLVVWYSYSVSTWAANAMDSALRNGPEAEVPAQAIGFSALVLWCLHPLTWAIGFFAVEGLVRFLAGFSTEQAFASLPFCAVDWLYGKASGRPPRGDALHTPSGKDAVRSFISNLRQQVAAARTQELTDELAEDARGEEHFLLIRATHEKPDWIPPRVVRVGDAYFALDAAEKGAPPRRFVYRLRRLQAGVPGRKVLLYQVPPPPYG